MKRYLSIISIILIVSLLPFSAFAEEIEESSTYSSAFFTSTTCYLYSVDDDTFGVWFDALGRYRMDVIGVKSIQIQRSSNGTSSWTTMKTFSSSMYSCMLGTNTVSHGDSVVYSGAQGYYYRAFVIFYAEKDGNSGRYTSYTDRIYM